MYGKIMKIITFISFFFIGIAFGFPTHEVEQRHPLQNLGLKYDEDLDWRVVGGSSATSPSQFPYMVSLRMQSSHFCGASILSNVWMLTAAHCTVGSSASSITAVVGTTTLNAGGTRYSISRIINNPGYNPNTIANDIALIRAASSISFNNNVRSIPIGTSTVGGGVSLVLSGWGRTSTSSSIPNNLQWITLQSITVTTCQQRLAPRQVYQSSLCTLNRAGQGACNGDSGGPLVANGVQVGVVSWGIPCAQGYPDVFARVSSFADWIISSANS